LPGPRRFLVTDSCGELRTDQIRPQRGQLRIAVLRYFRIITSQHYYFRLY
jgi:hypothetical protein